MRTAMIIVLAGSLASGAATAADAPLYKTRDCSKEMVQMDINSCANDNYVASNTELNRVYKKLMAQQTAQVFKDKLRDTERAWITYRDKECDSEVGPQADGGSIWPMEMSNCLEQKTDERIRELKKMIDCPEGVASCAK